MEVLAGGGVSAGASAGGCVSGGGCDLGCSPCPFFAPLVNAFAASAGGETPVGGKTLGVSAARVLNFRC